MEKENDKTLDFLKDELLNLRSLLEDTRNQVFDIQRKLCMPSGIAQIRNARFYLPNFPVDLIQKFMVHNSNYWYIYDLEIIDKYLKDNATIIDVGANIGSYSIYWALERNAKKIYAFEPLPSTFEILMTNIHLNNLQNKIKPYQFGLSDSYSSTNVSVYDANNIGGTSFSKCDNGLFKFIPLDSLKLKSIDLLKIDVEGGEIDVLKGAVKTIERERPVVVIESFYNKKLVDELLLPLGYKLVETIRDNADYIYAYVD